MGTMEEPLSGAEMVAGQGMLDGFHGAACRRVSAQ